jgi:hypothetical protein
VLRAHYLEQDEFGLGGALWLWKENANDTNPSVFWGVYGPPFGPGVPQPERIRLTSRAYPLYLAGNLRRLSYVHCQCDLGLRGVGIGSGPGRRSSFA